MYIYDPGISGGQVNYFQHEKKEVKKIPGDPRVINIITNFTYT
jgi:hypothetical protein